MTLLIGIDKVSSDGSLEGFSFADIILIIVIFRSFFREKLFEYLYSLK